ncbi:aromatic amino acid ammonia-lyase [Streptacidiphilus sp. ASG 303]|uniref:HAL/PAL/TAL family ammonia-lyase n=1 Tax=Streptacidiphilus sp. ASG 303 TaxID=2896847 RepID=UPI001E30F4E7|nr:aromatic amino acid ammonia-lyase [Streptacidiphilus sp. ASG 303]MCD0483870.1 aromatic amino acid ammonia-lyase [Streptacidiphilus sp. ASG 303]
MAVVAALVSSSVAGAPARPAAAPAAGVPGPRAGEADLLLDGDSLTLGQMFAVLDASRVSVRLTAGARARMRRNRAGALGALRSGARVYGWNQALGPLKDRELTQAEQRRFQRNILLSNAAGTGAPFPPQVARLALVLRANQMARGRMGVRPQLAERLLDLVNAGVTPEMPQVGSLGIGDLQPMAEAGLVAIGEEAPARYRGVVGPASRVLPRAGLARSFTLEQGEALAVISGSTVVAADFVHALRRAERLAGLAEGGLALFMDATGAEAAALDARTHAERHIPGETGVAARLRALVAGSGWMTDAGRRRRGETHDRVQDAVSVRAAPHILGALREALADDRTVLEREAGSSTSNPLVFPVPGGPDEFLMGGNYDGDLLAHEIDRLNGHIADVGVLYEQLSARLLSPVWSYGLPASLAGGKVGLNSGMVQVQTVATALVPEMQVRAYPPSVLSRPAKTGQEDHNTMAMASVRALQENLDRLEVVIAVEMLMSAQGIDLIRARMDGLPLGAGTALLWRAIRRRIPPLGDDRWMSPDLDAMIRLVAGGELLDAVRRADAGRLRRTP